MTLHASPSSCPRSATLWVKFLGVMMIYCVLSAVFTPTIMIRSSRDETEASVAGNHFRGGGLSLIHNRPTTRDNSSMLQTSSLLNCDEHNCMLGDACIDYSSERKRFVLRLLGNTSHVQELKFRAEQAIKGGHREENTIAFEPFNDDDYADIAVNSTAAVVNRFVGKNCGHDLGDESWPIFRLMRLFSESKSQLDDLYFFSNPPRYCDSVLEPLAKQIFTQTDMSNQTKCYSRIFFGTRSLNYMADRGTWPNRMDTFEADMRAFRSLYYNHAQVPPKQTLDTIVVMEKRKGTHMNNIANRHEIVDFLKRKYPQFRVKLVSWLGYSSMEQIRLMSRTRVMISLPGANVMNGIFLPDDGALLMYCRASRGKDGKLEFDNSNEMKYWFQHLSYMQVSIEPCNNSKAVSYDDHVAWVDTVVKLNFLKRQLDGLGLGIKPTTNLATNKTYLSANDRANNSKSTPSIHDPTVIRRHAHPFIIPPSERDEICALAGSGPEGSQEVYDYLTQSLRVHNDTDDSIKLFCGVYTHRGGESLTQAQLETWAPRCDGYLAASSVTNPSKGMVDIPHATQYPHQYKGIWRKVRAMLAYIHEHYGNKYDYFHFNGDDVYLVVENLKSFLQEKQPAFVGQWLPMIVPHAKFRAKHNVSLNGLPHDFYYAAGGPGYTLSRATLKRLVEEILPSCHVTTDAAPEDVFVSQCLWEAGIVAEREWDETGAHRYHHMNVDFLARFNFSKCGSVPTCQYWKRVQNQLSIWHKDVPNYDNGGIARFVSKSSVSFHSITSPAKMRRIEKLIYRRQIVSDCAF